MYLGIEFVLGGKLSIATEALRERRAAAEESLPVSQLSASLTFSRPFGRPFTKRVEPN